MKRTLLKRWVLLALWQPATAQPLLYNPELVLNHRIYKDMKQANLFYYEPCSFRLAQERDGKPALTLLQMHASGSVGRGNSGQVLFRNILQFRMEADPRVALPLPAIRQQLQQRIGSIELRPLPVTRFVSKLVSTMTGAADSVHAIGEGYTENSNEEAVLNNSYWAERTYTIRLSDADAQLVERALRQRQSLISLSYSFYTAGIAGANGLLQASGAGSRMPELTAARDSLHRRDTVRHFLVKADALLLAVDADRWPQVLRKIDVNESLPPAYPLLDVYCYDFSNDVRPDLFSKKLEIKATSVNGSEVQTMLSFKATQPDVFARSIRFAYAIRFDRPYRYRVIEVYKDGDSIASPWQERTDWNGIIDISSSASMPAVPANQ